MRCGLLSAPRLPFLCHSGYVFDGVRHPRTGGRSILQGSPIMDHFDLLQRLAIALAIGLIIGIERGWTARDEAEGERTAGLRTLALSGLLGGVAGALAVRVPQ